MNVVTTLAHGIQTIIRDDDGMIHYHINLNGRLVWTRKARKGTHSRQLDRIHDQQTQEALFLISLAESEERDKAEALANELQGA